MNTTSSTGATCCTTETVWLQSTLVLPFPLPFPGDDVELYFPFPFPGDEVELYFPFPFPGDEVELYFPFPFPGDEVELYFPFPFPVSQSDPFPLLPFPLPFPGEVVVCKYRFPTPFILLASEASTSRRKWIKKAVAKVVFIVPDIIMFR